MKAKTNSNSIFLIVSSDAESGEVLHREMSHRSSLNSCRIDWHVSPVQSANLKTVFSLDDYGGIILLIDRETMQSEVFNTAIRRPLEELADRADFVVVPWFKDLTLEEFKKAGQDGNPLAISLRENIHLVPEMETISGVFNVIREFNEQRKEPAKHSRQMQGLTRGALQIGYKTFQSMYYLVLTAVVLAIGIQILTRIRIEIVTDQTPASSLFFPLVIAFVCVLLERFTCLFGLLGYGQIGRDLILDKAFFRIRYELYGVLVAMPSLVYYLFKHRGEVGGSDLLLGLFTGVSLITIARAARREKLWDSAFEKLPKSVSSQELLNDLYSFIYKSQAEPGTPFIEPPTKRVFISYSRSSTWSTTVTNEIASKLRQLGAYVFLDRSSLNPGQPWKLQLGSAIVDSNVFISVLDGNATRREWVALEFAQAYRSKISKRTPEIFVVHKQDMSFADAGTREEAFFNELMIKPSRPIPDWMRSKMAAYDESMVSKMCEAIRHYPIAGALGFRANVILAQLWGCIISLCGIFELLGIPFIIWMACNPSFLESHKGHAALFASASLFMGAFTGRCGMYYLSGSPLERKQSRKYFITELFLSVVFFSSTLLFRRWLIPTDSPLLFLCFYFGLATGKYYAVCTKTWQQHETYIKQKR